MYQERLKALRSEKKMTQADVANHLGITRQAYAKYENGKTQPDIESLIKLANLYNVTTDYILGVTDSRDEKFKVPNQEIEDVLGKANLYIGGKKATEEQKEKAIEMFKLMFGKD